MRALLGLEKRRVVLAVARLVPIKNLRLLIDAVAMLRRTNANVHLLIVGDGPEAPALKARATQLGLDSAVTFAGAVPFENTPSFYRSADVFALSSSFDNSPNAVLEAMASGLPVVATDVGGVAEFVSQPAGGAIVENGNAAALAAALERFLSPDTGGGGRRTQPAESGGQLLVARQRTALARRLPACHRRAPWHRSSVGMKVAVRDDDACYFTGPAELARVYDEIWERVPICLATVPFAIGYERVGIPRQHWHSGASFPLAHNTELRAALREWIAARRVDHRAARVHARGFSSGIRISGGPRSRASRARGAARI